MIPVFVFAGLHIFAGASVFFVLKYVRWKYRGVYIILISMIYFVALFSLFKAVLV